MILAIFGISLATITTNIAANVVAPGPSKCTGQSQSFQVHIQKRSSADCIAFQPWRLLKSSESFVYTWRVGYAALLGPIGGIVLTDYYLIRLMNLSIKDLYSLSPYVAYYYSGGSALAALKIGILPVIPGFLQKLGILSSVSYVFVVFYKNACFFSFFSAGLLYWILSSLRKQNKSLLFDPLLPPAT